MGGSAFNRHPAGKWVSFQPALTIAAMLIRTAILNGVDPQAWLTDVLEQMVSGRVNSRSLASLLPWAWRDAESAALAA
jgi:hypothetical protein